MGNKEIRKRSGKKAVLPTIPQNTSELRQQVIEASGITIEKLSEQFTRAIQALDDALQAEKTQIVTWEGKVTDQFTTPDHGTRLKAIQVWGDLTGVGANKASLAGSGGGSTQINIQLNAPFIDSIMNEQKTYEVQGKVVDTDKQ